MGTENRLVKRVLETHTSLTSSNPTLKLGQQVFVTGLGTNMYPFKIGDGVTTYNNLAFAITSQDDGNIIGSEKKFFTYKDRTDLGYLPYAFDNAVSQTTYSLLYAEIGDIFEIQHTDAGDGASGAGNFYPTPIPGAYDRSGIPDVIITNVDTTLNHFDYSGSPNYNNLRNGISLMFKGNSGDTLPTTSPQIDEETIYYGRFTATECLLYPTEADAVANTNQITVSTAGSGTFRLTQEGIILDDALEEHGHEASLVVNASSFVGGTGDPALISVTGGEVSSRVNLVTGATTTNETRPKTNYMFSYIKALKI